MWDHLRQGLVGSMAVIMMSMMFMAVGGPSAIAQVEAKVDPPATKETTGPRSWPREIQNGDATIVLQRPQLDLWKGDRLTVSIAASVDSGLGRGEVVGSLVLQLNVLSNTETGEATLYNFKFEHASFDDELVAERISALMKASIPTSPITMPLTRLTGLITDQTVIDIDDEPLSKTSPMIYYREKPAVLLMLPEREKRRAFSSGISMVADADHPLFEVRGTYYLFDGVGWLSADSLDATVWADCRTLPEVFDGIPDDPQFAHIKEAVASLDDGADAITEGDSGVVPEVIRSSVPAELVVVDGTPEWTRIAETPLLRASNTDSDLFLDTGDNAYYLLVSGRWFKASSPSGDWAMIDAADVPKTFATIPDDVEAYRVVASVPGTIESKEALAMAQVPEMAAIDRNTAALTVVYDGAPKFQAITGTPLQYGLNTATAVIRAQGRYYAMENAVWFESSKATGPWAVASSVPSLIYTIPPESPLYYVTFVRIYNVDDNMVVSGYTSGYTGVYVSGSVVVYGTGYDYPYYYWPRWYWGRPPVWGYNRWYNPNTGRYVASRNYYGPNGRAVGYGWSNPSTGWAGRGYQASSPYAQWGRNVATNGSTWVRTGHVTNSRGTVVAGQSTNGNQGVASNRRGTGWTATAKYDDDRYVGNDGNVYRRDGQSWTKYDNGNWVPATGSEADREGFRNIEGGLNSSQQARDRSVTRDNSNRSNYSGSTRNGSQSAGGSNRGSGTTRSSGSSRSNGSSRSGGSSKGGGSSRGGSRGR
jgi:hypothetical protein